jgi:hypothetical protein
MLNCIHHNTTPCPHTLILATEAGGNLPPILPKFLITDFRDFSFKEDFITVFH